MGRDDEHQLPTCPMCRANWKDEPLLRSIHVQENLDPVAVQGYVDWLYTRKVVISDDVLRTTDKFNVAVLKCWAVAAAMGDGAFGDELVRLWFEEAEARFWSESVKWVFVEECGVKDIKVGEVCGVRNLVWSLISGSRTLCWKFSSHIWRRAGSGRRVRGGRRCL